MMNTTLLNIWFWPGWNYIWIGEYEIMQICFILVLEALEVDVFVIIQTL